MKWETWARKMDFRRQEGRRAGERERPCRFKQTSERKQKLMKQDVTIDGSLHPSKHGTLAGPVDPPPSSPSFSFFVFVPTLQQGTIKHDIASVFHDYFLQQPTAVQHRGARNWPPYAHIHMCLRLQVNWIRSHNEPGWGTSQHGSDQHIEA